jgi:RNA polymerase sigma-70 factor (ECF subfamily)
MVMNASTARENEVRHPGAATVADRGAAVGLRLRATTIAGTRVSYVDEGHGPPVVLLHGAPHTSLAFLRVIRELRGHHRVIAPDLPGFGGSEQPPDFRGTLEEFASFVVDFCADLRLRLCLNELDSARARKEESRGDRLPEPVDLEDFGLDRLEVLDQVSMAFLVLLQRLTPAERAVLLLHDVFALEHAEIAALLDKTDAACRQLLRRAREHIAVARRTLSVSKEEHRRLLRAFIAAAGAADVAGLQRLLADEVMLVADAGAGGGFYGRVRNLSGPLRGRVKVAAFVAAVAPQGAAGLEVRERELNGQPAIVLFRAGRPYTVLMIAVADGQIASIFLHADASRLSHLGGQATGYSREDGE